MVAIYAQLACEHIWTHITALMLWKLLSASANLHTWIALSLLLNALPSSREPRKWLLVAFRLRGGEGQARSGFALGRLEQWLNAACLLHEKCINTD